MQKTNREKDVKGRDVVCDNCEYSWRTQSRMYVTTCPRCRSSVRIGMEDIDEELCFDISALKGYNNVEKV